MEAADLIVINTCAIREGAEQKVIGRQGHLARLKAREPRAARRPDRLFGPRARSGRAPAAATRRSTCSCGPTRSPSSSIGSAWPPPRRRSGAVGATTRSSAGPSWASPTTVGDPGPRRRGGERRPRLRDQRLAADHLRLRQDLHLLHRAVQPRPGAQPPVRRHRRRGAGAGRRRLPRGHAARPERQLATATTCAPEPRFAHVDAERWAGRQLDLARPPGPRRADPRHRRAPHRRRPCRRSRGCAS